MVESLFDVGDTVINNILDTLKHGTCPLYDMVLNRWIEFPLEQTNSGFEHFVSLANRVVEECSTGNTYNGVRWLNDRHSFYSPPSTTKANLMKPNIVVALNCPETAGLSPPILGPIAPWRRILAPVAASRKKTPEAAALQLLKYIRQVFRECPDRRFVIGLTFVYDLVSVYLADRSGVLGSEAFNPHDVGH